MYTFAVVTHIFSSSTICVCSCTENRRERSKGIEKEGGRDERGRTGGEKERGRNSDRATTCWFIPKIPTVTGPRAEGIVNSGAGKTTQLCVSSAAASQGLYW